MYKAALLFLLLGFQIPSYADSSWVAENKPRSANDIAIFTRQVDDQPIRAFRGVMQVSQAPLDVLALLMDLASYSDWVYQLKKTETEVIEGRPKLIYMAFKGIWPTKGRDVLVDFNISQNKDDGQVHIHVFNSDIDYPKQGKYVRIPQLDNHWYITPMSNGLTEVEFQTQFRAGGKIPNWLMNMVLTMAPKKTMQGMQELLKSGRYHTKSVAELPIQTPEVAALKLDGSATVALNK